MSRWIKRAFSALPITCLLGLCLSTLPAPAQSLDSAAATEQLNLAVPVVVPVVARVSGYTTDVSFTNGAASSAPGFTLTYRYTLHYTGEKGTAYFYVSPVAGRKTVTYTDIIGTGFGITSPSYGSLSATLDGRLVINSRLRQDPYSSYLPAAMTSSCDILQPGCAAGTGAGLERSAAKRTNLILSEVKGGWASVYLEIVDPATNVVLGSRTFSVGPYQYLQINDIFGPSGVQLPAGDYRGMNLRASFLGGTGSVGAVYTIINNTTGSFVVGMTSPYPPCVWPCGTIGF